MREAGTEKLKRDELDDGNSNAVIPTAEHEKGIFNAEIPNAVDDHEYEHYGR